MSSTTALQPVPSAPSLAPVLDLGREKVELLKRTICQGATDDELELFAHVCRRTGLDPFARQIHFTKRRQYDERAGGYVEKMSIQTGIDGFRLVADRTGQRDGDEGPFWCGKDGKWVDVWLMETPPAAARVVVWRKGHAKPYVGTATWGAYVQTKKDGNPNRMWSPSGMGPHMLAKCAEALALRKAFPMELGGLCTTDEMGQADSEAPTATKRPLPAHGANPDGSLRALPPKAAALVDEIRAAKSHEDLLALATKAKEMSLDERSQKLARAEWRTRSAELARQEMGGDEDEGGDAEPPHDPETGEVIDAPPPAPPAQPAAKPATKRAMEAAKSRRADPTPGPDDMPAWDQGGKAEPGADG